MKISIRFHTKLYDHINQSLKINLVNNKFINAFRIVDIEKRAAGRQLMSNISSNAKSISMKFHATAILIQFLIFQLLKNGQ